MRRKILIVLSFFVALFTLASCNFTRNDDSKLIKNGYDVIVTFDAAGGSIGNYTERRIYCKKDSYIAYPGYKNGNLEIPSAVKSGYILGGWYTGVKDEDGNIRYEKEVDVTTYKVSESITLYAKWENYYTYTILWNYNEETKEYDGSKQYQMTDKDALISAPSQSPTYAKHTFLEYYADPEFKEVYDWSKKPAYDENRNVNIYAKFLDGTFTLASKASDLKSLKVNTNVYLLNDIDMTGQTVSWSTTNYSGKFIGNGYTISNLTINKNQNGSNDLSYGLFKTINGATFENVTFDNLNLTYNIGLGTTEQLKFGILAATIENATFTNVTIKNSTMNIKLESSYSLEATYKYKADNVYYYEGETPKYTINCINNKYNFTNM